MQISGRQRRFVILAGIAVAAISTWRIAALSAANNSSTAVIGKLSDGTYFVPTGQTLTPAGKNTTFDGRPVDVSLSPDGKLLAVMLQQTVKLFDTATCQFLKLDIQGGHSFGGIAWSKDSRTLFVTGQSGRMGSVSVVKLDDALHPTEQKPIQFEYDPRIKPNLAASRAMPSGLALSADEKTLYVSLFNNGTLATVDLSSYNPETGEAKVVETPVGSSPESICLGRNGDKVYIANRGGRAPVAGDTLDPEDPVVVDPETYKASTGTISVVTPGALQPQSIQVGLQPIALTLSPDGQRLYVANANSDTISVIDTASDTVTETIPVSPAPGALGAACPNGIAVAKDGHTLYVTLGGDNAVEVLDLDQAAGGAAPKTRIAGLIPTAWFPLAITISSDGRQLFVANSKGIGSLGAQVARPKSQGAMTPEAGPGGAVTAENVMGHSVYNVVGSVSTIPVPGARELEQFTAQTARNNRFDRMSSALTRTVDPYWKRFKHVILIIKENRTYDQVFGDVPVPPGHVGGDPKLVMFGEKVTPNHHALARTFGLFDNLYCSGAISADGHHWLNEAFASDYAERGMNNYPRSYPCCGTDPLVFAGNKFLWQAAMDAGKSFKNYGEFGPLRSIKPHSDPAYNTPFAVSADRGHDVAHSERIVSELESSAAGSGLADFTMAWFGNDHTSGTRPGSISPEACLADNDLAVGRLVDSVTHSKKYWHDEPTVIFVVEDDAQGGLDHVEGHRTVGLVISSFNRRKQVFSSSFNQLNMIRTIESILGLKPLNQFDAAAQPMREVFQEKSIEDPYSAIKNNIALNEKNPGLNRLSGTARHWAQISSTLDFSAPDRADPEKLTEALWRHTHGSEAYPPATAAIDSVR